MMKKILLCMFAAWAAMISARADKLDLIKTAEFRVGSEYCTSKDSLKYNFFIKGDSVLVDEIVLSEDNKNKMLFEVREGGIVLYKDEITKFMTKGEMEGKTFTLKVGHKYEFTWGNEKRWVVSFIKKQPELADLMVLNDGTIRLKEKGTFVKKNANGTFILNDSNISISSIGFDSQYTDCYLFTILDIESKNTVRNPYENKIVKLNPSIILQKSKKYVIILKGNEMTYTFNIGEIDKPLPILFILIGGGVVLLILVVSFFFIRKRWKKKLEEEKKGKDSSNTPNVETSIAEADNTVDSGILDERETSEVPTKLDADSILSEPMGKNIDSINKQDVDDLKQTLDEYVAMKEILQNSKLNFEDRLEMLLSEYNRPQQAVSQKENEIGMSNKSIMAKAKEPSPVERLNFISKNDEHEINRFILEQLVAAGFNEIDDEIDYDKTQYTNYLRRIKDRCVEKNKSDEEKEREIKKEILDKLKQQGLDMKSFADDDVKSALKATFLQQLNKANFKGVTVEDVFEKIKQKETELNDTIESQTTEINGKKGKISQLQCEIKTKKSEIDNLNSTIDDHVHNICHMRKYLVDLFFNDLSSLKEACNDIFLVPCTNTSNADCMAAEESFFNRLKEVIDQLKNVKLAEDILPADYYLELQGILEAELKNVDGAFNAVCRYYAYSRIPFMADDIEYGKKFKRNAMFKLFGTLDKLLTDFGLHVIIPHLFADTLADGKDLYEDYTGQKDAYSDLSNLCPNVKYRKEYVDYSDKDYLIYDIVIVGYSKEGCVVQKAKVLV